MYKVINITSAKEYESQKAVLRFESVPNTAVGFDCCRKYIIDTRFGHKWFLSAITEKDYFLQGEKAAPEILLRSFCNPYTAQEYRDNLTAVFEVDESEARFFDVDDLTERVTDDLGTYYKRKSA